MLFLFLNQLLSGRAGASEDAADPYDALYDVVMTRYGQDGKSYAKNESSPSIFLFSEFPFGDKTYESFNVALDAFAALPQAKIEAYSDIKRALLQRHLWKVFDVTFPPNYQGYAVRHPDSGTWPTHSDRRAAAQPKIASLIQRLALTKEQILALPNTMAATVTLGGFAERHDPRDQFKSFLPGDPFSDESPWVCLGETGNAIPASVHTSERRWRSAFFSFMRLPEGRMETLKCMEKLKDRTEDNEVFPVGTQFALIDQAFLISDDGELILSPLVVSIQLRAYLDLDRHARVKVEGRLEATQCLAEFNMQPRELMKGNAVMKAMDPDGRRYEAGDEDCQLSGGPYDRFEKGRMPNTTRLNLCILCHGGPPATSGHSVLTGGFRSTRLKVGSPKAISEATSTRKRDDKTWKTLRELWQADAKRD